MVKEAAKPQPAMNRDGSRRTKDGALGWHCRVWDSKRGAQRSTTFYGTEREAVLRLEEFRLEVKGQAAPMLERPHAVTVGEWAREFLKLYEWKVLPVHGHAGVRRPKTTWTNMANQMATYIVPALGGDTRLSSVTPDRLTYVVATLKVNKRQGTKVRKVAAAAATKDKMASSLRVMFAAAVKAGLLVSDPSRDLPVRWGDAASSKRVVVPSLAQVEALATAMDQEWDGRGDIVRVLAFTGMRWQSLSALTWEDIDEERASIHLWRGRPSSTGQLSRGVKGTTNELFIALLPEAVDPLRRLRKKAEELNSEWVLTGARGKPLTYRLWMRHLKAAQEASGVDYTAHALRHVAISLLIAGGSPLDAVRRQAGHKSTSVTESVYRHALNIDQRHLLAQLRMPQTTIAVEDTES